MYKKLLYLIVLLLCVNTGYSIVFNTTNIDFCDRNFYVSVNQKVLTNSYDLIGCHNTMNNYWSCNCKNNFTLLLNVTDNISNTYDLIIQYHNEPYTIIINDSGMFDMNPESRHFIYINNLSVGEYEDPPINNILIIIGIIVGIMIIIGIVFFVSYTMF